jgi:hypothetical protein
VLLEREKINEKQKIPGSPPAWAPLKKCFDESFYQHYVTAPNDVTPNPLTPNNFASNLPLIL